MKGEETRLEKANASRVLSSTFPKLEVPCPDKEQGKWAA